MLNKVIMCGRLTDDPQIRDADKYKLARFKIACDRDYHAGKERQTDFVSCSAFGSTADFIYNYFCKGDLISIVGRLQIDEDHENKRSYTSIKVESAYFGGAKKGDSEPNENHSGKAKHSESVSDPQTRFLELNGKEDGELPF